MFRLRCRRLGHTQWLPNRPPKDWTLDCWRDIVNLSIDACIAAQESWEWELLFIDGVFEFIVERWTLRVG